jgi:hypothetical protein
VLQEKDLTPQAARAKYDAVRERADEYLKAVNRDIATWRTLRRQEVIDAFEARKRDLDEVERKLRDFGSL